MALMTSCPACSTRFKVVPDQLRLHHGLVRCGACDHVFDANTRLEAIVDVPAPLDNIAEESSPEAWYNKPAAQALVDASGQPRSPHDDPQWTQMQPPSMGQSAAETTPTGFKRGGNTHVSRGVMNSQNAGGEVTLTRRALSDAEASGLVGRFDHSERYREIDTDDLAAMQAAAQQAERRKRRAEKKRAQAQAALDAQASLSLDDKANSAINTNPQPAALKAQPLPNTALWRTLGQWLTVLLSVLAGLAAAAQLLLMGRFAIADSMPVTRPLLAQACAYAGCAIEPAMWLQPLSLDALTLSKPNSAAASSNGLQTYRMQATVRNSSQLLVKKPDIELTISNVQGAVIARKTIAASSFSAQSVEATIKPSSDWLIDAALQLDEQTVGYTARVVYLP
jgi:predicted Zn finger-like uncharacterized protein